MPYVMFVPAYWALGDITKVYCAAAYAADEAIATDVAYSYARRKAVAMRSLDDRPNCQAHDTAIEQSVDADVADPKKLDWDPTKRGRCGWTRVGAWVGKPVSFDASAIQEYADPQAKRQINSTFAFGLGYVPNAYMSLLAGISYNNIVSAGTAATTTTPAKPDEIRRFVSLVFGFGGNLDILGIMFK